MTKVASAAYIKSKGKGNRILIPGEGTLIRQVYDLLVMYKGRAVPNDIALFICKTNKMFFQCRKQLEDFYGMDIRSFSRKTIYGKGIKGSALQVWCLVGEWKDGEYCDYLVQGEEYGDHTVHSK